MCNFYSTHIICGVILFMGTMSSVMVRRVLRTANDKLHIKAKCEPPQKKTNGHSKLNAAAVGFGNYSSVADFLRLKRSAMTFFL